eukprot:4893365-Pyramimonas_sp.AAC.1
MSFIITGGATATSLRSVLDNCVGNIDWAVHFEDASGVEAYEPEVLQLVSTEALLEVAAAIRIRAGSV